MNKVDWLEGAWTGLSKAPAEYERGATAVRDRAAARDRAAMTEIPAGLHVHRKLERIIGQRRQAIEAGDNIDWATAEHLAFGSLVLRGLPGAPERSGRRAAARSPSATPSCTIRRPRSATSRSITLTPSRRPSRSVDSFLSEAGVLGFEYGYSLADPNSLVLWEAQFGDFANGAQVYFDQFIASGEAKWLRMSGLVCLLPHGYEGQGPEHSSARLERFLQLYAKDNIQVLYPSTPASYFHALRRQMHRPFRKPLIVMTPKSLLRHKLCTSSLEEMGPGSSFHRVMYEQPPSRGRSRRDPGDPVQRQGLLRPRAAPAGARPRRGGGTAPARAAGAVPGRILAEELARFPQQAQVVWCQEEPQNMGAWSFVAPRIEAVLEQIGMRQTRPVYAGRPPAASPATGLYQQHVREQTDLVETALTGGAAEAAGTA